MRAQTCRERDPVRLQDDLVDDASNVALERDQIEKKIEPLPVFFTDRFRWLQLRRREAQEWTKSMTLIPCRRHLLKSARELTVSSYQVVRSQQELLLTLERHRRGENQERHMLTAEVHFCLQWKSFLAVVVGAMLPLHQLLLLLLLSIFMYHCLLSEIAPCQSRALMNLHTR